jgi:hypothetical protein
LTGLEEGVYRVKVLRFGDLAAQWYDSAESRAFAKLLTTQLGREVRGIDLALRRARTIAGTVRDPVGTPVPYARVKAYLNGERRHMASTMTAPDGSFTTKDLPVGQYQVRVEPADPTLVPEWWNKKDTRSAAGLVQVTQGQGFSGLSVSLRKAAMIRGTITNTGGRPVAADIAVYPVTADEPIAGGTTDQDGKYSVGGLPAGNYEVRFDPHRDEYATQWWDKAPRRSAASAVTLPAGGSVTADVAVAAGGTLTGIVTDPGGQPLPGVSVRAHTGPTAYRSKLTDSTGRYTFMGLDDEDYRVRVVPGSARLDLVAEWFEDHSSYDAAKPVRVPNGQTVSVNVGMEKGATISGRVTDAKGPVSGIGVDVFDEQANKSLTAWTNADGRYTSSALRPGKYRVRFMPGYYGGDGLVEQWWDNEPSAAQADVITLAAQDQRNGVNALLRPVPVGAKPPGAPTGVTVTAGDGSATVTWSAPADNGGLPVTRYSVQGLPGGTCDTQGELTCTVGQLTNGVAHTFTVVARNSAGASPTSLPSAAVTPFGRPDPPTSVTATAGAGSARVSWVQARDNGRPVTEYVVTSSPGDSTCTTDTTSCVVSGLTPGATYTFTVTAKNVVGTSGASAPSTGVTIAGAGSTPTGGGGGSTPPGGSPSAPAPGTGSTPAPVQSPGTGSPTAVRLQAPSGLTVKVKKRRALVRWKAVPGATFYQVKISASKGKKAPWKAVTKRKLRSAKFKKGKYLVRVRVVGPDGAGPAAKKKMRIR